MSQASTATNTFRFPEKLSMAFQGRATMRGHQGHLFLVVEFQSHTAGQLQPHTGQQLTLRQAASTTASGQRIGSFGWAGTVVQPPRCRRRFCVQAAKVGYLIPAKAANCGPLKPLRSNSSSRLSRRAVGVRKDVLTRLPDMTNRQIPEVTRSLEHNPQHVAAAGHIIDVVV